MSIGTTSRRQDISESLSTLQNISRKAHRNALLSLGDLVFKCETRGPKLRLSLVHKDGVLKEQAKAIYEGRAVADSDRSKLAFRTRQKQAPEETLWQELQRFEEHYGAHIASLYDCLGKIAQHVIEARDGKITIRFDETDGFQMVGSEEL